MQPLPIARLYRHPLQIVVAVALVFVSGFHPLMHTHPVGATCDQDCCGHAGFEFDCSACLIAFVTPAIPGDPPMLFVPGFETFFCSGTLVIAFNCKPRVIQARAPPSDTCLSV
jgi:hypothetical protein